MQQLKDDSFKVVNNKKSNKQDLLLSRIELKITITNKGFITFSHIAINLNSKEVLKQQLELKLEKIKEEKHKTYNTMIKSLGINMDDKAEIFKTTLEDVFKQHIENLKNIEKYDKSYEAIFNVLCYLEQAALFVKTSNTLSKLEEVKEKYIYVPNSQKSKTEFLCNFGKKISLLFTFDTNASVIYKLYHNNKKDNEEKISFIEENTLLKKN